MIHEIVGKIENFHCNINYTSAYPSLSEASNVYSIFFKYQAMPPKCSFSLFTIDFSLFPLFLYFFVFTMAQVPPLPPPTATLISFYPHGTNYYKMTTASTHRKGLTWIDVARGCHGPYFTATTTGHVTRW